ncbi:MAG: DedA family protein [Candidatus Dormibacteria bacterium]
MALDLNPDHLLHTYGYLAIFAAPLIESTGIPFPGETVLLAGAVYASTSGRLSLAGVVAAAAAGAVVGDNFGYLIGRAAGRALLERYGGWVRLTPRRLELLDRFFQLRGPLAVFVARFVVVLRTVGALFAGAAEMRYPVFLLFNALGGAAWATTYGVLGFELGHAYRRLEHSVSGASIIVGAVLLALLLVALVLARRRLERWAVGSAADPPPRPRRGSSADQS